ncbi:MAG: tRNA pseudouridine(55) synthase TruB [Flavobacteriaceae bacterium]
MLIDNKKVEEGLILPVYKPLFWSSFDVVKTIRFFMKKKYRLKKIKVGHAGTLDPLATGLLLICTGKKTKDIEKLQALKKTYYTTFYFGATTPSFDLETDIDQVYDTEHINNDQIIKTINTFKGEIVQEPPIYSAIKKKGKKLYDLARKGIKISDIKKRKINVFEFCVLKNNFPEIDFKITCSKGTYIRTIANDLGKNLNTGAFVKHLERFSIGDYNINKSISINEFKYSD